MRPYEHGHRFAWGTGATDRSSASGYVKIQVGANILAFEHAKNFP